MAASNEWTEFHLTPKGWIAGTNKEDYEGTTKIEPPEDRVITCVYREYCMFSLDAPTITTEIAWTSNKNSEIQALSAKYGECPQFLHFPRQLTLISELNELYRL